MRSKPFSYAFAGDRPEVTGVKSYHRKLASGEWLCLFTCMGRTFERRLA